MTDVVRMQVLRRYNLPCPIIARASDLIRRVFSPGWRGLAGVPPIVSLPEGLLFQSCSTRLLPMKVSSVKCKIPDGKSDDLTVRRFSPSLALPSAVRYARGPGFRPHTHLRIYQILNCVFAICWWASPTPFSSCGSFFTLPSPYKDPLEHGAF